MSRDYRRLALIHGMDLDRRKEPERNPTREGWSVTLPLVEVTNVGNVSNVS